VTQDGPFTVTQDQRRSKRMAASLQLSSRLLAIAMFTRIALIALLRQRGMKTVRTWIDGKFSPFITGAYRVSIGTLAALTDRGERGALASRRRERGGCTLGRTSLIDADKLALNPT
jgi:hypothetical protein